MQVVCTGFLLNHLKYGDNNLIINLYTREFGRISGIVSRNSAKQSKKQINLLQPLFLLECELIKNSKSDLHRIKSISLTETYKSIQYNTYKSCISIFLAEVLHKSIKEPEPNTELFTFVYNTMFLLDNEPENFLSFHLFFMVYFLQFLGILPQNNYSAETPFFNLRTGYFIPNHPPHTLYMNTEQSLWFQKILKSDFSDFVHYNPGNRLRREILDILTEYYAFQIENFGELKSLPVLQQIFNDLSC